jgi:hypothetical protein
VPKSKKSRKAYRPRGYLVNPLHVLNAAQQQVDPLVESEIRDLQVHAHVSLKSIETGHGEENDIMRLAIVSNIALILSEHGLGPDYIPEVKEAQRHIVALQDRWNTSGHAVLTGPGIIAIRRMLELYDAQLEQPELTTQGMARALRVIHDRMVAGNVWKGEEKPRADSLPSES